MLWSIPQRRKFSSGTACISRGQPLGTTSHSGSVLRTGFVGCYRTAHCAPVAQLDRAPDYESGGQEFESLRARHSFQRLTSIADRPGFGPGYKWVTSGFGFGRREEGEERADRVPRCVDCPLASCAQRRLELGECVLDGLKSGAAGRTASLPPHRSRRERRRGASSPIFAGAIQWIALDPPAARRADMPSSEGFKNP